MNRGACATNVSQICVYMRVFIWYLSYRYHRPSNLKTEDQQDLCNICAWSIPKQSMQPKAEGSQRWLLGSLPEPQEWRLEHRTRYEGSRVYTCPVLRLPGGSRNGLPFFFLSLCCAPCLQVLGQLLRFHKGGPWSCEPFMSQACYILPIVPPFSFLI